MDKTLKNAFLLGVAVLAIVVSFAYSQLSTSRTANGLSRDLGVSELLEYPANFSSRRVTVTGYLSWHPNEPTLFADEQAITAWDFPRSIHLEVSPEYDFGFADKKLVVVTGKFVFSPERQQRLRDYKGFIRVYTISIAGS